MSFWSKLAGSVANVASDLPIIGKVPVVSDILQGVVGGVVQEYEQNKEWEKQTDWQKYMTSYQNEFTANQNQLQRDFNSAEAQKSRLFNSAEAEKTRNWQESMWNKQNEYNTPLHQLELMQDAGLNPQLFDAGSPSAGSAGSSSPASGTPATSSALGASGVASVPSNLPNPSLIASEIEKNNAETDKLKSEEDLNEANKTRVNELLSGEKENQHWTALLMQDEFENLRPAQVRDLISHSNLLDKQCSELDVMIKEAHSRIANLDEDTKRKIIENKSLERYLEAQIKEILSRSELNDAQKKAYLAQVPLYAQQLTNAILQGGSLAVQFEIANKSKDSVITSITTTSDKTSMNNKTYMRYQPLLFWMDEAGKFVGAGVQAGHNMINDVLTIVK